MCLMFILYICFKNVIVKLSRHPRIIFFMRMSLTLHCYNHINTKVRSRRLLGPSTVLVRFTKIYSKFKLTIYPVSCYINQKKSNDGKVNYCLYVSGKLMGDNSAIQISIPQMLHKNSPSKTIRSNLLSSTKNKYRKTNYIWLQN